MCKKHRERDDLGFALTLHMAEFPVLYQNSNETEREKKIQVINELNIGSILCIE